MADCTTSCIMELCWTTNIGSKWQIVIPKEVREKLGLDSWDSVTFILKDNKFLWIISNSDIDMLLEYIQWEKNITLIK